MEKLFRANYPLLDELQRHFGIVYANVRVVRHHLTHDPVSAEVNGVIEQYDMQLTELLHCM